MSKQTDTSLREPPNLIREETQVESGRQTPQCNIVLKRQVRDSVIDSEGVMGTDRVLIRVGGCMFVYDCVFVCLTIRVGGSEDKCTLSDKGQATSP